MMVAGCRECGQLFSRNEILFPHQCPVCGQTKYPLEAQLSTGLFTKSQIERLWKIFGDVPIGDNDHIQECFMDWPWGTDRFEIWHWFDEQYWDYGGVAALLYVEENQNE